MRIACPHCGPRDLREFVYRGAALTRPEDVEWSDAWDDYLHLRDNPAGWTEEFWYHTPCGSWARVIRDTVTHQLGGDAQ